MSNLPANLPVTERTRGHRLAKRACYERARVYEILDEGLVCHVSFVHEGHPVVLPTAHVRVDDHLYLHGSSKNRMLDVLAQGAPACVAVTLLDGLVLARSQFHHSMNYRSVVIFGRAEDVTDPDHKQRVLAALCDHLAPGRSGESRPGTRQELAGTRVLALPIEEASAKCRSGPPIDGEEDLTSRFWAGVVPIALRAGPPLPAPELSPSIGVSSAVQQLSAAGGWGKRS
jgi:nitroimidazol reductase NimA-like FMN-containing flavoprotein (pyridoxamine 5'-phosphate oxidase superfamily)